MQLYDEAVNHALYQLINEPTQITATSKSCLDLIFCNRPGFILDKCAEAPIFMSDHSATTAVIDFQSAFKGSPK
jgi:hypothetical protein